MRSRRASRSATSAACRQLAAAVLLAVPALLWWPAAPPTPHAWLAAGLLAIFATGFAYILYFRLIANAGPTNAVAVTYLIPLFAVLWGGVFLDERVTVPIVVGCAVIFLGTALATGVLAPLRRRRAAGAGEAAPRP
jgi:drug/metabolite transporter (DMT)-like permease